MTGIKFNAERIKFNAECRRNLCVCRGRVSSVERAVLFFPEGGGSGGGTTPVAVASSSAKQNLRVKIDSDFRKSKKKQTSRFFDCLAVLVRNSE